MSTARSRPARWSVTPPTLTGPLDRRRAIPRLRALPALPQLEDRSGPRGGRASGDSLVSGRAAALGVGRGRRGRHLAGEQPDELGARVDVELPVDAGQVELDGLRAQEEGGGDVAVRCALRRPGARSAAPAAVSRSGAVRSRRATCSPLASSSAGRARPRRRRPGRRTRPIASRSGPRASRAAARPGAAARRRGAGCGRAGTATSRPASWSSSARANHASIVGSVRQQAAAARGGGRGPAASERGPAPRIASRARVCLVEPARPDVRLDQVGRERQHAELADLVALDAAPRSGSRMSIASAARPSASAALGPRPAAPRPRSARPTAARRWTRPGRPGARGAVAVAAGRRQVGEDREIAGEQVVVARLGRQVGRLGRRRERPRDRARAQLEQAEVRELEREADDVALGARGLDAPLQERRGTRRSAPATAAARRCWWRSRSRRRARRPQRRQDLVAQPAVRADVAPQARARARSWTARSRRSPPIGSHIASRRSASASASVVSSAWKWRCRITPSRPTASGGSTGRTASASCSRVCARRSPGPASCRASRRSPRAGGSPAPEASGRRRAGAPARRG